MDLWPTFIAALKRAPSSPFLRAVDCVRLAEISRNMEICPLQDPLRFRASYLARAVAEAVVGEEGKLLLAEIEALREDIQKNIYWIGPGLEDDFFILEHIALCLDLLLKDEKLRKKIPTFSPPVCHQFMESILRQTLWPAPIKVVHARDLVRAVLATWFTPLRQITGSCFATAPAIFIQREQPLQFFQDLQDLVTKGMIVRVVEGKEYRVPLSPSTLHSDLLRPLLPADLLPYSPGLQAAFVISGVFSSKVSLEQRAKAWEGALERANTVLELIEEVLLEFCALTREDVKLEKELEKMEMNPLLASQSAVYYRPESARAKKVKLWKEKVEVATAAYLGLSDTALLRSWESTLASFSDVKVDFGRWNLYISLGMDPNRGSGIGLFLYRRVDESLHQLNEKLSALKVEYEEASRGASALEVMFERSLNEAQRSQIKSEWMSAIYRAESVKREWEETSARAESLASLFAYMIGVYDRNIPTSFQEIFDPALTQKQEERMDDSPAGFRLAYRHGALWTFVLNEEDFIRVLVDFFIAAEREMVEEKPEAEEYLREFSKELIHYIQTAEFLEEANQRAMANPILQGKYRKAWEYVSGGTMHTLLMAYYQYREPLPVVEKKIETPRELLSFLVECRKEAEDASPCFMFCPTHAFLFYPNLMGEDPFEAIKEMERFWRNVKPEIEEREELLERFSLLLPRSERELFFHRQRQQVGADSLREQLIDGHKEREEMVDAFLYESLPLLDSAACRELSGEIESFEERQYWTPAEFRERYKKKLLATGAPFSAEDIEGGVMERMRKKGMGPPSPIIFGDTNWTAGFFGLAISPNGELDLWRFHRMGVRGAPMREWFYHQGGGSWGWIRFRVT